MSYNLTVKVIGGAMSGKTALAQAITKALRKISLYGVALDDGNTKLPADSGPIKVLVQTELNDPMLANPVEVCTSDVKAITKADLKACFMIWEAQRRRGELETDATIESLPIGQVAEGAANHLWKLLEEQAN